MYFTYLEVSVFNNRKLVNAEVWNATFLAMFLKDDPQVTYADDLACKTECSWKYSCMWWLSDSIDTQQNEQFYVFLFCICKS